jgi:hypothetical protein
MRWWGPRWLWVAEGFLATSALLLMAYKAAMWVRPLGTVRVGGARKELSPRQAVQENYRRHPEGFIRILDESWRYEAGSRTATHSFTLKSNATVVYEDVEVRLEYASPDGRVVFTHVTTIPGPLLPARSIRVPPLEVRDVPPSAAQVTATIVSGRPR